MACCQFSTSKFVRMKENFFYLNGFKKKDKTFLKQKKLLHFVVTVAALEVMLRKTERVLELSVIWKKLYCLL